MLHHLWEKFAARLKSPVPKRRMWVYCNAGRGMSEEGRVKREE